MQKLFLAMCLTLLAVTVSAQEKPPANYENWGVCPFECCTYRDWTANDEVPVHSQRDDKSPVTFSVQRGEQVEGLTGVVVTEKPGVLKINRTVDDGFIKGSHAPQLKLHAGDVVYLLTPLGEGYYLFWYHGKVDESGESLRTMPQDETQKSVMKWWKLVRNSKGTMGWTRAEKFDHINACG